MSKSVLLIIVKNCAEMLISFPKECNKAYAFKIKKSFSCYVICEHGLENFSVSHFLCQVFTCVMLDISFSKDYRKIFGRQW